MKISAGLVLISDNKILLCHPTNAKWFGTYSIPKGQVEEGEDYFEAALRETREEIGIWKKFKLEDVAYEGYINYKDFENKIYKKVFYFVIYLDSELELNKNRLQLDEVDWAGFITKEAAEKRIHWRLKPLLDYIK